MRILLLILGAVAVCQLGGRSLCADPVPAKRPPVKAGAIDLAKLKRAPVPAEVQALVLVDLQALTPIDQLFSRYLWIPDATPARVKAVTLALGYCSRASVPVRPVPLAGGQVLRVDLRRYAPRDADLQEWIDAWEQLRFDPAFNLLLTRDVLDGLLKLPDDRLPIARVKQGKRFVECRLRDLERGVDVVRLTGPHLDQATAAALQDLTQSAAPIVEYRYFTVRALSTIQDQGVYRQIWGGLYYEFAGIRTAKSAKKEKATDLDLLLEQLGVGNVDKGITAKKLFEDLRSDQRTAMFRSDVTGKWRSASFLNTLAVGQGRISTVIITNDPRDQDIDIGQHPIMNLLNPKVFAHEVIWVKADGLHGFGLYSAVDGSLQREVPPDVASDRTIPAPYMPRLQAAISCIRCHTVDGGDGWKPMRNDVKKLLGDKLDVFGDGSEKGRGADTVDRIAGLYKGSPDKLLTRARDDYAEAVLRLTGPFERAAPDQSNVTKLAAEEIADIYARYTFEQVDPQQALRDIGFISTKEQAAAVLSLLLPPDPEALVFGIVPEDPRLGALKLGLSVNRSDWSMVYAFAAARSQKTLAGLRRGK